MQDFTGSSFYNKKKETSISFFFYEVASGFEPE